MNKYEIRWYKNEGEMLDRLYADRQEEWQKLYDAYELKFDKKIRDLRAEDVVKVDPRLVHLKTHEFSHNADTGENTKTKLDEPIAEGVQYDRMVPGLINIIKRLNKRVETLETKVAALGA